MGGRGLAQSNMVFQHTKALPMLIKKLPQLPISAIAVSAFPRREEDSYMPAFLVGKGMAESLGHMMDCPVYYTSHQENHILAAMRGLEPITTPYFGLHVSGGTTELLYGEMAADGTTTMQCIGGSSDLHAGQFVDRVGVAMGLPFPAGPHMETLAKEGIVERPFKLSLKDGAISFSGPASEAARRIERGDVIPENMAREVFACITRGLVKLLDHYWKIYHPPVLIAVGGVMSNTFLREGLEDWAQKKRVRVIFAEPRYSSDNASGNAYGAKLFYEKG